MHRLRLCCIVLGLFACSRSEQGPGAPWVNAISPAEKFFPIQTGPHALACNACHGGTQSFQVFDCTTSHPLWFPNSRNALKDERILE